MKGHTCTRQYTFHQFNDEINDFYKYLKDNNFTDDEIRKIFAPLTPRLKPKQVALILGPIILLALLYLSTYIETISWHLSALGRILLIKLLPLWDWTSLKNAKCLIEKPSSSTIEEPRFNCDLCENIHQIDVYDDISGDFLKQRYIDVHVPVIVKKSFPKSDTFIDDLVANSDIAHSKPCGLSTNIHNDVPPVKDLLAKTRMFDSFFLHFQNCAFPAMKQFRAFTPRPSFVPPELSPVQYNWLLWSRDYNVSQYKEIGLVEKVAVVGQILGANFVKLVPRNNCGEVCQAIDVKLGEGESLVVTSLWNLEYRPDLGENVAVILEMH